MKPYCTQNNGDCSTCSLVNYNRDCCNVPIHGGNRPGSGRPSVGDNIKKPRSIKFSDVEWETVKKKADAEGISASEYIRGLIIINNNEIKRVVKSFVSAKDRTLREAEELKERDADCFNNHIKWLEGRASAFESAAEWLEEILK